ncbi:MAG: hypothetical protein ACK5NF_07215 [Bacilli bacterium]
MKIVNRQEYIYNIEFCDINDIESFLTEKRYFLCIDHRVLKLHKKYLSNVIENSCGYITIDSTENNKNFNTVNNILSSLFNYNVGRNDIVVSIGGGVCGDIVGYAASIYRRGVNYIAIPTTLLAQVDSSIGGKVGINYLNSKNMIGAIYFPKKVFIDINFLKTLTTRQYKNGLAEIIKHGILIDKSVISIINCYSSFSKLIEGDIKTLIKKSINAKNYIVMKDVDDRGYRNILNFGHSFAHAIELNNDLFHGECVYWGMLIALYDSPLFIEIKKMFERLELIRKVTNVDLSTMKHDKKCEQNFINEIFVSQINVVEIKKLDTDKLIEIYQNRFEKIKNLVKYCEPVFVFKPSVLKGEVVLPPSKSMLHRYLIAGALSENKTVLDDVSIICDDINATIDALKNLGSNIEYTGKKLIISKCEKITSKINMKESGTSLRLLLPLLIHLNDSISITGEGNLPKRPLDEYFDVFMKNNIEYKIEKDFLPIEIKGKFSSDVYHLKGDVSSQFISGLLFLLPLLKINSKIIIEKKLKSLSYVLMTISTLKDFGINIKFNDDYSQFYIEGNQKYISKKYYQIECDYSAKNFFDILNSFNVHSIKFKNLSDVTLQKDAKLLMTIKNNSTVDVDNMPDSAVVAAVYFAVNGGVIKNVDRLKYKESNRLMAICDFLDVMGANYKIDNNCLIIEKGEINGGDFDTYNDHRVVMALIVASTIATSDFYLKEISSFKKSFPNFIECYEIIGGLVDEK